MRILLTTLALFLSALLMAQAPALIPYQAVARDAAGQPLANSTINARFTIHDASANGTAVWQEMQTVSTSALGLFTAQLGSNVSLNSVNWAGGAKFMQVEVDLGSGFVDIGTQQMLSVPYALFAGTAASVSGSSNTGNFTHYIGEEFGGGVVFYVWKDAEGQEHGLIVDKVDLSAGQAWSNITDIEIGPSAQSLWDGLSNSNAIVSQPGHTGSAAALCLNSTNSGQTDWYLPSVQELNMLWSNYFAVVRTFSQIAGATLLQRARYWSSTEDDYDYYFSAWTFSFDDGNANGGFFKGDGLYVRAVRAF
jgi:hypothetical protein